MFVERTCSCSEDKSARLRAVFVRGARIEAHLRYTVTGLRAGQAADERRTSPSSSLEGPRTRCLATASRASHLDAMLPAGTAAAMNSTPAHGLLW
jgi:hypothetical protein